VVYIRAPGLDQRPRGLLRTGDGGIPWDSRARPPAEVFGAEGAVTLAARFRKPWPILAGVLLATLANHALAGVIGVLIGHQLKPAVLDAAVGISMLGMALWMLKPDTLDENDGKQTQQVRPTRPIADAHAKSKKAYNNVVSVLRCAFDYGYRDTPERHSGDRPEVPAHHQEGPAGH